MTMCCPLQGGDDDNGPSDVIKSGRVKARKIHACCECRDPIVVGEVHEIITAVWDRELSTYRTCLTCDEIRAHFGCNGFVYGELWNDLEANFFPGMACGGGCMSGLSPAAKRALIEACLEWVLDGGDRDAPTFANASEPDFDPYAMHNRDHIEVLPRHWSKPFWKPLERGAE